MSNNLHSQNKALLQPLQQALYDYDPGLVQKALQQVFAADARILLAHPFNQLDNIQAWFEQALQPLYNALPDLERRTTILMAGNTANGSDWVGYCGYYTGTFVNPWLDIPPTGHQIAMRLHEFFRIEDGKIVEMQALWDIPELMMQAGVWPMVPSLGREWHVPAPATQDGLRIDSDDQALAQKSLQLVGDMLAALGLYSSGGVEAMRLEQYWHPCCNWYGPSGIGTARGLNGFRNWHQIPFLNAMPDRVGSLGQGNLFADGHYVGFTAWPGMHATITHGGWLGIAPAGQQITLRSLDFWRCEGDLIRENWVLVDLLDVYQQIGVDVFARLREFNKARAI